MYKPLAEEIDKASTIIPRSILALIALNRLLRFVIVMATLFCLENKQDALDLLTSYSFIEVFLNIIDSNTNINTMVNIIKI